MSVLTAPAARNLAGYVGRALSLAINDLWGLGRERPLHPKGTTYEGVWVTEPGAARFGSRFLDEPDAHGCTVRVSRAVGLPDACPDIEGVAVKFPGSEGGDLLFAGTGGGRASRFCLVPRRTAGTCTTLFPLQAGDGLVVLRLEPAQDPGCREIWVARPTGSWNRIGRLQLGPRIVPEAEPGPGTARHNPVLRPPYGLTHPPLLAALRAPSYLRAQAGSEGSS